MADIVVTAARVAVVDPTNAEIFSGKCTVAITAGQAVYFDAAGQIDLCNAAVAATAQIRGIALEAGAIGQVISVLKRGLVAGFTIPQAYDAQVFASAAVAGALADAAGAVPVPCGRVVPMRDRSATKVIYFNADWTAHQWS